MKKLVLVATDHGIPARYIDDSIQNEYAPDDALSPDVKNADATNCDHWSLDTIASTL